MYFNILFLFQKTGRVLPLAKKYSHLLTYKFVLGARLQGPLGRFAGTGRVMEASEQVSRQRREMRLSLIGALSHLSRARYRYTPSG